ncbi:MAG TPA: serine hydrolase [Gemmatimonadaceae bacterium]|nr:serine hydrolase [Gemmatimonadaceae bacterium]
MLFLLSVLLTPDSLAVDSARLAVIDRVAVYAVQARGFPGVAIAAGRGRSVVWKKGYGRLDYGARSRTVDPDRTLYDLASLTKVIATTTAVMVLYDQGKLRLEDRVGRWIPEYSYGPKASVTIRDLLTHRAGLPSGRALSRPAKQARKQVLDAPLVLMPGTREIYSDLGPDVLAFIVERVSGERFDAFVTRRVFRPLGMRNTRFNPPRDWRSRIAPTEVAARRGYALRGEVHDANAWALGGIAGHAGLFSTAGDLSIFAQMMLNGGVHRGVRIVSDSAIRRFTTRTAGWRALGWETCYGGGSCGHYLSERAYGHTGYAGTSIWIDPDRQTYAIVLTNWVHAGDAGRVAPVAILADLRADVSDIVALSATDPVYSPPPMPDRFRADRKIGWTGMVSDPSQVRF